MMSAHDKLILEIFTKRLQNQYQGARVMAFGSRARGDATWEPDYDLLILCRGVHIASKNFMKGHT